MGANQSGKPEYKESPDPSAEATLYYYAGRGRADQIRWVLAATSVRFVQKVVNERTRLASLAQTQLPFGELPLLQIDNVELVQPQAIIRYLANRANIAGSSPEDALKCDMIAETCRELIDLAVEVPFKKVASAEVGAAHVEYMRRRWLFIGSRFEAILARNGGKYLVGSSLSYADVLVAHALTWYVEECGAGIVERMPRLIDLQNTVIETPGVREFIRSSNYYPLSGEAYVKQVLRIEQEVQAEAIATDDKKKKGK